MTKRFTITISKIQTIIIIILLISSITVTVLAWSHISQINQNNSIEQEIPQKEQNNENPSIEPSISDKEEQNPPEPNEQEEPTEPNQTQNEEPEPPTELEQIPPSEKPNETESPIEPESPQDTQTQHLNNQTNILETEKVTIGSEEYFFNFKIVNTTRPDLFQPGQFSMFDILVHLDEQNKIELEYHFDNSLNAHIIDSINGEPNWWYETYYSGGWLETNVFRPDHYPWKQKTTLKFFQVSDQRLEDIYLLWQEEIQRKNSNNGSIIIPEVIIQGETPTKKFTNVKVTPHNLRNDSFQENVITAIDVILSLGDEGKIEYELQWYDSIGTAQVVRSYWVNAIDNDRAHDRCGFVYVAGDMQARRGNHIHLPSDSRILNSPEYVLFFWICI
jgi:hypothetical protein